MVYRKAYMDSNQRGTVLLVGIVLIIMGLWILMGWYPFTGKMFAFPTSGQSFIAYVWWFIFKGVLGLGMPIFGGWAFWNGLKG